MKFNYATKRLTNYEYQRNVLLGFNGILLVLLLIMSLFAPPLTVTVAPLLIIESLPLPPLIETFV